MLNTSHFTCVPFRRPARAQPPPKADLRPARLRKPVRTLPGEKLKPALDQRQAANCPNTLTHSPQETVRKETQTSSRNTRGFRLPLPTAVDLLRAGSVDGQDTAGQKLCPHKCHLSTWTPEVSAAFIFTRCKKLKK